ncbi:MAG: putative sugar O-methyltransferase [Thermodesulfobacteriota bacterium]
MDNSNKEKITNNLGAVWTDPIRRLRQLILSSNNTEETFVKGLAEGFFTQYTSYTDSGFINAVIDWQIDTLKEIGCKLEEKADQIHESKLIPTNLVAKKGGRHVSMDFLRLQYYIQWLQTEGLLAQQTGVVLEIGSGYGSFARMLKLHNPEISIVLCDVEESLWFAGNFLTTNFPDARILKVDDSAKKENYADYDFVFVPLSQIDQLKGRSYDLAVNIWSFSEISDAFLQNWFLILQGEAELKHLFLLNAFLARVTPLTMDRMMVGNWLSKLDNSWNIKAFEIDPAIHRCPLITDFSNGIGIIAERVHSKEKKDQLKDVARKSAEIIINHADWVKIAGNPFSVNTLLYRLDYVARPHLVSGLDGPFFCLWNYIRLSGDKRIAALLCLFLRMLQGTPLSLRATKEELHYLRFSEHLELLQEYNDYFLINNQMQAGLSIIERTDEVRPVQFNNQSYTIE